MSEKSFLVVGLGNIGAEYAATRHNIGFMILDVWAQTSNIVFRTERYGDIVTVREKGRDFHLLKPSTYMNLSGNAVRYWMNRLEIPAENIMIVCDDINLPFGTLRLRRNGSDGGHNGLKNIQELIGTRDFARLRCGVGHEFEQGGQVDFVLGLFSPEQRAEIPGLAEKAITGIKTWAMAGIDKAMNFVNTKSPIKQNGIMD